MQRQICRLMVSDCFAESVLGRDSREREKLRLFGLVESFSLRTYRWMRWKSVRCPFSAEYMHIGATQMRF
jgi:hypothetical protein